MYLSVTSSSLRGIKYSTYRPFLHGKTKQANDIIIKENNVVISDKREITELFNAHFIQIADGVPLMKETDYGQHFENFFSKILALQLHCEFRA